MIIKLRRNGDYFHAMGQQAAWIGSKLGLVVTKDDDGKPVSGFPHYQLQAYRKKLESLGAIIAVF